MLLYYNVCINITFRDCELPSCASIKEVSCDVGVHIFTHSVHLYVIMSGILNSDLDKSF